MSRFQDQTIRRRSDGSIDIPFYARHAARQRRAAMKALPVAWFRWIVRAVTLGGAVRAAHPRP